MQLGAMSSRKRRKKQPTSRTRRKRTKLKPKQARSPVMQQIIISIFGQIKFITFLKAIWYQMT
ncbi:MAG: hypothetical protein M3Q99_10080 [Acidobacteriota bacterium]|nr:hypothetical protein [Acidobacteriota bacterium]